jgi:hypothetical protein
MNWNRLSSLDRRYIFLLMALVIIIPILVPTNITMGTMRVTQSLYDTVDSIDRTKQCLLISSDYTPQTEAENHPMVLSLLRHAFARRIPVLINALYVEGAPMLDQALKQVMGEFNARATSHADSIVYGRDVVYLGWQPPPIVPILSMGQSIRGIYPIDYYDTSTDSLALTQWTENYDQVGIVVAITSGQSPLWYVMYAQPKYGVKVGGGCTAVNAPDFYPYYQTGQLSGLMAGMKGAAEYETLVEKNFHLGTRRKATEAMASQSAAHVMMMVLIIIGNIAFFATRGRKS